jgi:hypothetical protein
MQSRICQRPRFESLGVRVHIQRRWIDVRGRTPAKHRHQHSRDGRSSGNSALLFASKSMHRDWALQAEPASGSREKARAMNSHAIAE